MSIKQKTGGVERLNSLSVVERLDSLSVVECLDSLSGSGEAVAKTGFARSH